MTSAPMWVHAGALLLGLVALVPVVGTGVAYSADEGAAIIEARSLAAGDGWIVPHPFPEVDPRGDLYPLEHSTSGPEGTAAYAKHPAYPWALSIAERVGGQPAMLALSVIGTWLAALGAAALALRLLGGFGRAALWLAGAGTPLLFDAYWVIAHSLAAAAIAWAAVALVTVLSADAARRTWAIVAGAAVLVGIAGMLRTEAVIYGAALGLAAVVAGASTARRPVVVGGLAVGLGAVAARVLDAMLAARIVGEPVGSNGAFAPRADTNLVGARVDGFVNTWLRPGPAGDTPASVILVLVAAALIVGAALALRRSASPLAVGLAGAGAGLIALRAVALPARPLPGLLIAFPLLLVGAIGLAAPAGRRTVGDPRRGTWLVAGALVIGWAGVLATQYPEGGVAEWGGRYFAIGMPLAVPLVLVGLQALLAGTPSRPARLVVAALAIAALGLSAASIRELRRVHRSTDGILADIDAMAAEAGPGAVIVTDAPPLPRLGWEHFDRHRWLLADPAAVPDLPDRLARAGVQQWVLVSADPDGALHAFEGLRVVARASPTILLVEPAP